VNIRKAGSPPQKATHCDG